MFFANTDNSTERVILHGLFILGKTLLANVNTGCG